MKEKKDLLSIVLLCLLVALLSATVTVLVLEAGGSGALHVVTEDQYRIIERYRRLDRVYSTLMDGDGGRSEAYYRELDPDTLILGAIRGLMDAVGDRYTFYYTPEELTASKEKSAGTFHGIGIVLEARADEGLLITRVYEGSPAEAAGLLPNDVLIAIDGTRLDPQSDDILTKASELVIGPDGTPVTITVQRGSEQPEFTCLRGEVNVSRVDSAILENGIGYIRIRQFAGDAVTAFRSAVSDMRTSGIRGLVLDLRDDPGGYLDDCVAIADEVLPEGLVAYTMDRRGRREESRVDDVYWDIPMVVLVNGNSASASELFTAAFRDRGRGTVVGTTTYGKGIVQTLVTFNEDGAGMQYTTATYYSPSGTCIHEKGVTPDVIVEPDEGYSAFSDPEPEQDRQLKVAIEELEKLISKAS